MSNAHLTEYFVLIKKITDWKVKNPEHRDLKEDISQEVFLKLYKNDFFSSNDTQGEVRLKKVSGYITQTVMSCYLDHLHAMGLSRRLTKAEREHTDKRYEHIVNDAIEDISEGHQTLQTIDSSEQAHLVREAYDWIKSCFDELINQINDCNRRAFFEAAFWQYDQFNMPMKKLASHVNYSSSNPTQEFKRFTQRVSLCTEPHGVTVNAPHEQVQFIREQFTTLGVEL